MNINTSSWHYRYNVWRTTEWKTKRKNTLCSYFWFTVYNIFILTLGLTIALLCVALGGDLINEALIKLIKINCYDFPYYAGYAIVLVYGFVFWAICIGLGLITAFSVIGIAEIFDTLSRKVSCAENPNNILLSWLKAKKRKICPLIDFVGK